MKVIYTIMFLISIILTFESRSYACFSEPALVDFDRVNVKADVVSETFFILKVKEDSLKFEEPNDFQIKKDNQIVVGPAHFQISSSKTPFKGDLRVTNKGKSILLHIKLTEPTDGIEEMSFVQKGGCGSSKVIYN